MIHAIVHHGFIDDTIEYFATVAGPNLDRRQDQDKGMRLGRLPQSRLRANDRVDAANVVSQPRCGFEIEPFRRSLQGAQQPLVQNVVPAVEKRDDIAHHPGIAVAVRPTDARPETAPEVELQAR